METELNEKHIERIETTVREINLSEIFKPRVIRFNGIRGIAPFGTVGETLDKGVIFLPKLRRIFHATGVCFSLDEIQHKIYASNLLYRDLITKDVRRQLKWFYEFRKKDPEGYQNFLNYGVNVNLNNYPEYAIPVPEYLENYEKTNGKGLICIPSGNHDMDRLARSIQGVNLKIAFAFLLSMPGAPFIYYGDEIGMRYVENLTSVEGGYGRTGSRSPMQWDSSTNAGFSSAPKEKLYIRQDESADRPTVALQQNDPDSLYHEVKKLISIRKAHPALLSKGKIRFVFAEKSAYPLAYVRTAGKEQILVILNPSGQAAGFHCEFKIKECIYSVGEKVSVKNGSIKAAPLSAGWYLVD